VPVRAQDQAHINEFAVNASGLSNARTRLADVKAELELLDDAETEAMLCDEEGSKRARVADGFFLLADDEFEEHLATHKRRLTERRGALADEVAEIEARQAALKAELYARFGNQIGLEA